MCASMASNIYHPLTAFYFILVAVIWCSASVTRRFADHSYFAFRTSVLAFSLTDCVWGSVICGQIAVPLAVRHLLCDIFFFTLVLSVATLGHYLARSCRPDNRRSSPQHWKPRTNQSPTGALVTFAALGRAVRVLYRPPQKNPQTEWSGDRGGAFSTALEPNTSSREMVLESSVKLKLSTTRSSKT